MKLGYWMSSEEHRPLDLVNNAKRAESLGLDFAVISDHFHPWVGAQGQGPFVWSVLGAIASQTTRLRIGTGVTCPLIRTHPVVIAQAAATVGAMIPGRFFLGVGSGEYLNEHVTGARWPGAAERLDMLEEAIEVIRELWKGDNTNFNGRFYTVDDARIYTLPSEPVPILVASSGEMSAKLAGRVSDGLICTSPDEATVSAFESSGGAGKPRVAQMSLCWAKSEAQAVEVAHEWWPNSVLEGTMTVNGRTPLDFEAALATVRPEDVAKTVVCGPDVERHLEAIEEYARAGFDYLALHQVGPDQDGFFGFLEREILPRFESSKSAA